MQAGFSQAELLHTMADFNLDMSKVHEDEAYKALANQETDELTAPKIDSNASQNLSILQSLGSATDKEDDSKFYHPPKSGCAGHFLCQCRQHGPNASTNSNGGPHSKEAGKNNPTSLETETCSKTHSPKRSEKSAARTVRSNG
jgi:hypothetical protein